MKLKLNMESNSNIEYLDLLITRQTDQLEIHIFWKPTTTDLTIHATSNHPTEQKLSAYRYYLQRLNTLPLTYDNRNKELSITKYIAKKNGYSESTIENLKRKKKK